MKDTPDRAKQMMPHVMALNKDKTIGLKNNRQPKPQVSNVTSFAKGGKVCAKPMKKAVGGAAKVREGEATQKGAPKVGLKSANLFGGK